MVTKQMTLLNFDFSGALDTEHGLCKGDYLELATDLENVRSEILVDDIDLLTCEKNVPSEKEPLDSAFLQMPEQLLAEYRQNQDQSLLGRILATAQRLRESVDRVVLLGIGGSYMGAKALMDACCHPYHNELSRADRGQRPRMYFEGNNFDNDSTSALLDMLGQVRDNSGVTDRWAAIVISKSGGTLETAVALRQFLALLKKQCASDDDVAKLLVPVTGANSKLSRLCQNIGCSEEFPVPDGVGGRFSVLSAVGLLPAAVLGLDIVSLLEGACAMNEHFRHAAPGDNAVLDYTATVHLMHERRGASVRVLSVWAKALETVGLWYDQLMAESLGKKERGATPLTVLNTRDLHSRAQQHQEGNRDKIITNVIVDQWKYGPRSVGTIGNNEDNLDQVQSRTLPELMDAAIQGTNQAYNRDHRCTVDLYLPAVDEHSLGQLFQMLMLSTVVEGRLIGINPYGQPGVQKYKGNMSKILGVV